MDETRICCEAFASGGCGVCRHILSKLSSFGILVQADFSRTDIGMRGRAARPSSDTCPVRRLGPNPAVSSHMKVWKCGLDLALELGVSGGVLSLAASDSTLYACSSDGTIQSFDLSVGKNIGQVSSTLFQPQKLYADKTTKMLWAGDSQGNVAKYECGKEVGKYELVEEIWDMVVIGSPGMVYTARDRDVVVAEIIVGGSSTRVFVKSTFQGRSPLCVCDERLCFLSRDGRNVIVHENSAEKKFPRLTEVNASEMIINAMAFASDGVLYTGGYDSTVKKWNLNSGKCLGSVNLSSCINAIAARAEDDEVFVARSDGAISQVGA